MIGANKKKSDFATPYTVSNALTKGGAAVKLSALIMGLGNIAHKQIIKGLIFLAIEIGYIMFIVVSIRIEDDGSYEFVREQEGDTVADVLSYVEYDPRHILESLRSAAERAVREGRITPSQRFSFLQTFEDGLRGYTYFER